MYHSLRAALRRSLFACLVLAMTCALFLLTTIQVRANAITINDQAGVLDTGKIRTEAATFSTSLLIFTTSTFSGDGNAFNLYTRSQLPDQSSIVIGIATNTVPRNFSIQSGTGVDLSNSQVSRAISVFQSTIDGASTFQNTNNGKDYTGATIAALNSLQNALSGGTLTPFEIVVVILLCIGIAVVIVLALRNHPKRGNTIGVGMPPGSAIGGSGGGAGGSF